MRNDPCWCVSLCFGTDLVRVKIEVDFFID